MTDLELAVLAATEGAAVIRDWLPSAIDTAFKGDVDPVTNADLASESTIRSILSQHRPADAVVGEEEGGAITSSRTWVVDPLDGTVNFVHGLPHLAVSVALYVDGYGRVGVVADIGRREVFSAAAGSGAFLDGEPIRVSRRHHIDDSLIGVGFPYDRRQRAETYGAMVGRILGRARGLRRLGSAALDLAYVAAGRLDGYVEYSLQPWDVAAGAILVTEAGGSVTTERNENRPLSSAGPVVASNGLIHPDLLAVI